MFFEERVDLAVLRERLLNTNLAPRAPQAHPVGLPNMPDRELQELQSLLSGLAGLRGLEGMDLAQVDPQIGQLLQHLARP